MTHDRIGKVPLFHRPVPPTVLEETHHMKTPTAEDSQLPSMFSLRQRFPESTPVHLASAIDREMSKIVAQLKPGHRVAVGVGSRGITNLRAIIKEVLAQLKNAGTIPFIIPAMGSHGGATAEAQTQLLGEYGISEAELGVPIEANMDVKTIGRTTQGGDVVWAKTALQADAVMVVNRIKPHTDFSGQIGSGLIKMAVVGLGKRVGASNFHRAASHHGYEAELRERIQIVRQQTKLLGGLGLIENQGHQTVHLEWVDAATLEEREEALFQKALNLMPTIPFSFVDLLIIDRIGKNISGAGMDPNIIARSIHGYLSSPPTEPTPLTIRRIFVRDLTPETHGNAIGIGLADITTKRLVDKMNPEVTFINALTALSTNGAKVPIYFKTDREAILRVLDTLALPSLQNARILRIQDTLNLENIMASQAYFNEVNGRDDLEASSELAPIVFKDDQLADRT